MREKPRIHIVANERLFQFINFMKNRMKTTARAGSERMVGTMKKRFRLILLFLALGAVAGGIVLAGVRQVPDVFSRGEIAVICSGCAVPEADGAALDLIRGYFSMRCGSFAKAAKIRDAASPSDASLALSKTVRENERLRVKKLRAVLNNWDCRFSWAGADLRIEGWKNDGGAIVCSLYEFVWFKNWYRGHTTPESADLSGYGVHHVLRLQQDGGGYSLIADDYDEGNPTNAATKGRLDNPDYVAYAGIPSDPEPVSRGRTPALPVNAAGFVSDYRPREAIDYADAYTKDYNLAFYPDLESIGGDCCNFVSQCLYRGGLPLTLAWSHNGTQAGTAPWISSTCLYAELTGASGSPAVGRGVAVLRADDKAGRYLRCGGKRMLASSVIFPGSPVFYRWSGGFAADKRWNHTALCVGTMGDGAPAVSCHTDDKYHIKWNYGTKACDYGTVQLTPTASY